MLRLGLRLRFGRGGRGFGFGFRFGGGGFRLGFGGRVDLGVVDDVAWVGPRGLGSDSSISSGCDGCSSLLCFGERDEGFRRGGSDSFGSLKGSEKNAQSARSYSTRIPDESQRTHLDSSLKHSLFLVRVLGDVGLLVVRILDPHARLLLVRRSFGSSFSLSLRDLDVRFSTRDTAARSCQ